MGLERVARDALGVRLVQQVEGGHRQHPDPCVHLDNAAMVAQGDQERVS